MQTALEEFEKLVSRAPDNDEYLANLAGAYKSLGRHTEAIERCNEALSINNKNFIAFTNRAIARARLGLHAEALEDYNLSLAINPTHKQLHTTLGALAVFNLGMSMLPARTSNKHRKWAICNHQRP
jgi:tetratricopeptide (TPR) repeat protein